MKRPLRLQQQMRLQQQKIAFLGQLGQSRCGLYYRTVNLSINNAESGWTDATPEALATNPMVRPGLQRPPTATTMLGCQRGVIRTGKDCIRQGQTAKRGHRPCPTMVSHEPKCHLESDRHTRVSGHTHAHTHTRARGRGIANKNGHDAGAVKLECQDCRHGRRRSPALERLRACPLQKGAYWH